MKKHMLKNEKGITLIVLIITIVILAILLGVVIKNTYIGTDIKQYNYMCADIELIESKVNTYYNNKGTLPTVGDAFNAKGTLGSQASSRDNDNYYMVDWKKLTNMTLNYGGGTIDDEDVYIINEQSHKVYYLKGIEFDGNRYYAHKEELSTSETTECTSHTGEWITTVEPTCVTTGTKTRTCTTCGQVETQTIAATGVHTYGSYVVTKAATCVETGEKTATCTQCGKTQTQTIAATGVHTYGSYVVTKAATCVETGEKTATCTQCGATQTQTIPATGVHTYGAWRVVQEATTTSTGLQIRECEVCGNIEQVVIPIVLETISFRISNTSYTAVQGMTWEEWIASEYNTAGFMKVTHNGVERVFVKAGNAYITGVTATATITSNGVYTTTSIGGSVM